MILDRLVRRHAARSGQSMSGASFDIVVTLTISLAFGLAAGLTAGLTFGLTFGLAAGLTFGLAAGLTFGLAFGLTAGLAAGLAAGLTAGLADIALSGNPWLALIIVPILVLAELMFMREKNVPGKGKSTFWFTAERKAVNIFESSLIVVNIYNAWRLSSLLEAWLDTYKDELICFIGYGTMWVLAGLLVVAVLYGYVRLNMLKYRNAQENKGRR